MITSYFPERWSLVDRGVDPDTELPMCRVRRDKNDSQRSYCIWKLVQRPNGWYNVAQLIPGVGNGGWRRAPEKNGVKLSGSRADRMLLDFAEVGYARS